MLTRRQAAASAAATLLAPNLGLAQSAGLPAFDFEDGEPASTPAGWRFGAGEWTFTLSNEAPHGGRQSARLAAKAAGQTDSGGAFIDFDATPFRGRRLVMRAAVKLSGGQTFRDGAAIGLGVYEAAGPQFTNVPISQRAWTMVELFCDVTAEAQRVRILLNASAAGVAHLDDVTFEDIGRIGEGDEAPRALSSRGLAHLVAFARLFGRVRHFHPSDEAASANWETIAIEGVQRVEAATDARGLAAALRAVFAPYAPSLEVFAQGERVPDPRIADGDRIAWRHYGYKPDPAVQSPFRSERLPVAAPLPEDRDLIDIGGGVRVRCPVTVVRAGGRTEPVATARPSQSLKPRAFRASPADRTTRLATTVMLWNVVQHFYPYFDVVPADWPAELPKALSKAATDEDPAAFLVTLQVMTEPMRDGHVRVYNRRAAGAIAQVGWEWIGDRLVITAPPAGATDIRRGDVVETIDGVPTVEAYARLAGRMSGSAQWKRARAAAQDLRIGDPRRPLRLGLSRADGTRAEASLPYGGGGPASPTDRPGPVVEIRPGVFYIDLDRASDAQVQAAYPQIVASRAVIFDLRGYPNLMSSRLLFSMLLDGPGRQGDYAIMTTRRPDRHDAAFEVIPTNMPAPPAERRLTGKRIVLTDGRAISYAEDVLNVVRYHGDNLIVGDASAGADGNANVVMLPGQFQFMYTGMRVRRLDGSTLHGVGVEPTHRAQRTLAGVRAGRDEVIEAALALVP